MPNSLRFIWCVTAISLAGTACALPLLLTPDPNAIRTAAAQTVLAGLTRPAVLPSAPPVVQTATLSFTPVQPPQGEPPSATLTQGPTATLTVTALAVIPQISVSVPTNCRNGPGKVYKLEGALLVGEWAEVFARDPTNKYWYIRNPDTGPEFCWVWGEYATLTGIIAFLPIYTPPPTPTPTPTSTPSPDFSASYTSLDTCTGWWVEIKINNTGSIPFRSMGLTVEDTVTGIVLTNYTDGFTDLNGCLTSTTRDTLAAGATYVVSAPAFTYDPTGNKIRATLTLCSNPGQNGLCLTKKINFKP